MVIRDFSVVFDSFCLSCHISTVCSFNCDVMTTKNDQAAGYANGCLLLWAADSGGPGEHSEKAPLSFA